MVNSGQTISDYAPFLPVDRFPYHFGFHTLSSQPFFAECLAVGKTLALSGSIIKRARALGAICLCLAGHSPPGRRLTGRFSSGAPLLFSSLLCYLGSSYTTNGRFSAAHLIGPYLATTARKRRLAARLVAGGPACRRFVPDPFSRFSLLSSFCLLVWLVSLGRNSRWLAMAAGLALLLVAPRLLQLLTNTNSLQRVGQTIPNYNNFPASYFNTGWEQAFVYIAAAGVLLAIIAAIRRRGWAVLPLVLVAWVAGLFLLLSADRFGLTVTSLVNLNSMYIILFVPLAMFLAIVVEQLWRWLRQQHWLLQLAGYGLAGILLAAMFLFGVRQQIAILNSQTILAQPEDLAALRWVDANLPAEAKIAVNSWRWLGETWAAADGGAWLLPLTGRIAPVHPLSITSTITTSSSR